MNATGPVSDSGVAAMKAIMERPQDTLIGLDFDGTLAPIINDPEQAYAHPGAIAALARLGSLVGTIAVITGRPAETAVRLGRFAEADGLDLEVIDLRTLSPLDLGPVVESVKRTGHAIVVHEAARTLGLGAEIAARVGDECFYSLESPVQRVTGYDMPYPPSRAEDEFLPGIDRILDAVDTARAF
jgi:pyruvate/2-oxoglutarate/acetoin dehydrogenase E1 component